MERRGRGGAGINLGYNSGTNRSTPVAVYGNHTFCEIYSAYYAYMAVDNNGKTWGWGYNQYGSLSDGTTTNRYTPVEVLKIWNHHT